MDFMRIRCVGHCVDHGVDCGVECSAESSVNFGVDFGSEKYVFTFSMATYCFVFDWQYACKLHMSKTTVPEPHQSASPIENSSSISRLDACCR